jgi:hypothetical protein
MVVEAAPGQIWTFLYQATADAELTDYCFKHFPEGPKAAYEKILTQQLSEVPHRAG